MGSAGTAGPGHEATAFDYDFVTLAEAADLLRTPAGTLRYWRHIGIGPRSLRLGRRVLYRRRELDAWVHEQELSGFGQR